MLRASAVRAGRVIVVGSSAAIAVDVCENHGAECTLLSEGEGLGGVVDARWCEHSDDHALVLCARALLLVALGSGGSGARAASAPARIVERIPLPEGLRPASICALPAHSGGWDTFAAALLTRDGAVFALCPLVAPGALLPRPAWELLLREEVGEAARRRVPARAGAAGLPAPINGADLRARWLRENFCDDESGERLDAACAAGAADADSYADSDAGSRRGLVRYAPLAAPDALFAPGAWATCLQGPLRATPRDDDAGAGGAASGPAELVDVLARTASFSVAAAPAATAQAVQLPVLSLLCADGRLKTLLADQQFAPSWTRRGAASVRAGEHEHVNVAPGVVMPRLDAREQCLDFVRMRDEDAPGGRSFLVVEAIALPLRWPPASAPPPARPAFVPCGAGAPADVLLVSSVEGVFEITQFWRQPPGSFEGNERSRDPAVRLVPAAELGSTAGALRWAPGSGGLGALRAVSVGDGPVSLRVWDISLSGRSQFLRPPFAGGGSSELGAVGGAGALGGAGGGDAADMLDAHGGEGQLETRLHSLRHRLASSLARVQEAATAAHRDDERHRVPFNESPASGAPAAGGAGGSGTRDEDEDEVTAKRDQKLADEARAREMARVEEVLRRAKQHHAEQAVLAAFARDLEAEAEEWLDRGWRDTNTDARLGQARLFVDEFRERRARAAETQAALAARAARVFRVVGCASGARNAACGSLAEDLAALRAAARRRRGAIAVGVGAAGGPAGSSAGSASAGAVAPEAPFTTDVPAAPEAHDAPEARPAEVARADLNRALRLSALWARDLASDAEAELPRALRSLRLL